ncbi:hypothetical protein DFH09DRAFT_1330462 [Mycena vulgaris]|nr:hypothetical protein DFH09DRAFT_1330462 [Mycena vulgaris]
MPTYTSALSLALAACLLAVGVAWQKFCKSPPAWLAQLSLLGQPSKHTLSGTAIVCGGSIAGIVTARICADHFERVIVIDPEIQDSEKPKTRIMQYHAAHVILTIFIDGARRLWPSFDAEMNASGARSAPADFQIHYSGVPLLTPYHDYPPGQLPETFVIRRLMSQKVLHRLFMQHRTSSKITFLAGTLDGTHTSLENVAMIADCTGAAQAGLKWLRNAGFTVPDSIRCSYDGNIRYVTVCFTMSPELAKTLPIPAAQRKTMLAYAYMPHDEARSSCLAIVLTDNNTIQLVIEDTTHNDLPCTVDEIVPFVAAFPVYNRPIPSWVLEVIQLLCEHGNVSFDTIRIAKQSFVRYHYLARGALPSNFIALGDATMQLNPMHGHGFAKIMVNGMALNSLLHEVDTASSLPLDFSTRYFKNSVSAMQGLWDATRLHDYGSMYCTPMEGETNDTGRVVRWFEQKLISAVSQDEEVASTFWHIRHMLAADRALLAPTTTQARFELSPPSCVRDMPAVPPPSARGRCALLSSRASPPSLFIPLSFSCLSSRVKDLPAAHKDAGRSSLPPSLVPPPLLTLPSLPR